MFYMYSVIIYTIYNKYTYDINGLAFNLENYLWYIFVINGFCICQQLFLSRQLLYFKYNNCDRLSIDNNQNHQ